jgi:hypothetical protein
MAALSSHLKAGNQDVTIMKKIFLAMAIAFALTTAMTITTVIAHTDQSSAWEYASRSAKGS